MKQKIKEALRQEYKSRLELDDDRLDGVAAFASTFVTDESKIEEFVKNDATLAMLKSYQSVLDKDRAKRKANPEAKEQPSDNGNNPPDKDPDKNTPDIAAIVAQAVAAAINPLQEKLNAFESANTQKSAVAALDELKNTWDYAKGYPTESEDAYERVMELYEVSGKKWTADELKAKFTEKFNKAVSKKGVDTTKPFQSDGGAGDNAQARFEAMAKRQQERQGAVAE